MSSCTILRCSARVPDHHRPGHSPILLPHSYRDNTLCTCFACVLQAVRDALPEGWTLLTSLHLVGVDGQCLTTTPRGCKFEADMLVLDQQGVAVAIIEGELQVHCMQSS